MHRLDLADIPTECANWRKAANEDSKLPRVLAYILWGTEVDSLRTELNFISESTDFEALVNLKSRAAVVRAMNVECLPKFPPEVFTPEYNAGLVAESGVIAGLIGIASGERMDDLGKSSGDRKVAEDARKSGQEWLTTGWSDLERLWQKEIEDNKTLPWPDRIFGATHWDRTASLAQRVLSRLHQGQ